MSNNPTVPVGLDKHDPAGMAAWLRERGKNTRTFMALTGDQQRRQFLERWQQNVLPHLAFRFEQAARMIEELVDEGNYLRSQIPNVPGGTHDVRVRHDDTCPSLRSIGPEPCNCGVSDVEAPEGYTRWADGRVIKNLPCGHSDRSLCGPECSRRDVPSNRCEHGVWGGDTCYKCDSMESKHSTRGCSE